ncbi:methyltransferase family protein [Antricoccus suffuscus]|uniref:Methyltransferase family protein n=1 Tax=Antricoccus suffuscus TaxID=1629062 RepID=A0A2T0ZJV6_9ACTN|nr:class I SAM-dependent methyltransferase [Antricoccus suffuscus]PRZ36597.1 methyltransferase family protein [Antricoccus suffuscus]
MTTSSFDDRAATWDEPAKVERARAVASAISDAVPLQPSMRLLEYGAGTGLVSQQLVGAVGPITLADPSAGMRAVAEDKITAGTLPANTRVWDLDLSTGDTPDERFDLIVTVMALHHIADLPTVLASFATLLADGGRACIVDLEEEDGSFHNTDFDGHNGFNQKTLTGQLEEAGFAVQYRGGIFQVAKGDRSYPLFLAVCTGSARRL